MPFQFQHLHETQQEIRLLRLDVSQHRQHQLVQGIPVNVARYVALSYPWGDPQDLSTFNLEGFDFTVSSNLVAALEEVLAFWIRTYPERRDIFLWTDQICINQSDVIEKSNQVSMMGEIYAHAHRVLIWLPVPSGVVDGFQDWTEWRDWHRGQILDSNLAQLPQPKKFLEFASDASVCYPCASPHDQRTRDILLAWSHILGIVCSVWWERGWIYQEFMGPKNATFLIGGISANWDHVYEVLLLYFSQKDSHTKFCIDKLNKLSPAGSGSNQGKGWWRFGNASSTVPNSDSMSQQRSCLRYHGQQIMEAAPAWRRVKYILESKDDFARKGDTPKQYIPLATLLKHARNCQLSNPKDRIYAFTGLADPSLNIKIDYANSYSTNSVYVDTARAIIQQESRLDILAIARENINSYDNSRDRLPSWVPDWSTSDNPNSAYRRFIRELRLPIMGYSYRGGPVRASAELRAEVSFLPDQFGNPNRVLQTMGILVDELERLVIDVDSKSCRTFRARSGREIVTVKQAEVGDEVWILFGADEVYTLRSGGPFYSILGHTMVHDAEGMTSDIMHGGMILKFENYRMVNRLQNGEVTPTTIFIN